MTSYHQYIDRLRLLNSQLSYRLRPDHQTTVLLADKQVSMKNNFDKCYSWSNVQNKHKAKTAKLFFVNKPISVCVKLGYRPLNYTFCAEHDIFFISDELAVDAEGRVYRVIVYYFYRF